MRRVVFSMTIDPDGAMHDWVDLPEGWRLIRIPTQEAVHLIGIRAYQELLVDVCARERADVIVTHPPYDYLTPSIGERFRGAGTRVVGYAFDDEIFAGAYDARVRDGFARTYDRYATTRDVRWATAPLEPVPAAPLPAIDVALVGRAYARRTALALALRSAGLRVATRGLGWPEGFVSRARMKELYACAAVVLTTADWEEHAVPMVKHRLLDTAMLGVFQIAEEAPDLRGYFSVDEVPSYRDGDELVARVREALADPARRHDSADRTRRRALAEHTWRQRFPELIAPLSLGPERADAPPGDRSRLLDQLLLALATRAESDGRVAAAGALYRECLDRDPDEPTAAAGLGRCLRDAGELESALPWLRRAATHEFPVGASAIYATVPAFGVGAGLGRLSLCPPAAEPVVFLVATLVELGRAEEALATLVAIGDATLRRAVARTLQVGDDPSVAPIARWVAAQR